MKQEKIIQAENKIDKAFCEYRKIIKKEIKPGSYISFLKGKATIHAKVLRVDLQYGCNYPRINICNEETGKKYWVCVTWLYKDE